MTEAAAALFERGMQARQDRRKLEAVELLNAALAHPDGGLTKKERRACFRALAMTHINFGEWPKAETAARQGVAEFPKYAIFHQYLGEALLRLDRPEEGVAALTRALEIDPEQDGARILLANRHAVGSASSAKRRVRPWPAHVRLFKQPKELVRAYLLRNRPKDPFIKPETVFATLGSCFAGYVGEGLRAAGHTVFYELIGEDVNSTYANRLLLEWIENGPVDGPTRAMHAAYGEAGRERFRRGLAGCEVLVITLGVAASFFDENGDFVFMPENSASSIDALEVSTMRTASVAENVENISEIINSARRLSSPEVRIVLTVSPVPLKGTTEFDSAIVADCVSKSTLRVACHEVVSARAGEGVLYWPSFEIVRWLGAHYPRGVPRVFGEEDDNSRHVSRWLVDMIVGLFLEFHSDATS